MATADLLLEIGTEELPAREMAPAAEALASGLVGLLADLRLGGGEAKAYVTPRRLAALVRGVRLVQEEREAWVRGPSLQAAFDGDGRPTRAAEGFARGQGVGVADLVVRETHQGAYVFARKVEEGRPAREVLAEKVPAVILGLPFAKTMVWGEGTVRFARPIHWLVCLLGEEVVPLSLAGLQAGRVTRGHRVLAKGEIELRSPGDYLDALRRGFVFADREERKDVILRQAGEVASRAGVEAVMPKALLEEVVDLVEWPEAFLGAFPEAFLRLPEEVLETAMIHHQRYFPTRTRAGRLAPYFVAVRNGGREEVVRAGNEKVLRARLADAAFFYDQDLKTPLPDRVEGLRRIQYHARLGDLYERSQRLRELAGWIAREQGWSEEKVAKAREAGYLAKADLTTQMVFEFPELQGAMGRAYALACGLDPEVAQAIGDQYRPEGPHDRLPEGELAQAVALAEKFDGLAGHFAAGLLPTGSQDPYGLRRLALGAIRILAAEKVRLSLRRAVETALSLYGERFSAEEREKAYQALLDFFHGRLLGYLTDVHGISTPVAEAVLAAGFDAIHEVLPRAQATERFRESPAFSDFFVAFRRAANLAREGEGGALDPEALREPAEQMLYREEETARAEAARRLARRDYDGYFAVGSALRPALDRFFGEVLVMCEDEKLRHNRLALLRRVTELLSCVADLSRLSG